MIKILCTTQKDYEMFCQYLEEHPFPKEMNITNKRIVYNRKTKVRKPDREKIIEMVKEGYQKTDIAAQFGVSRQTIYAVTKNMNL